MKIVTEFQTMLMLTVPWAVAAVLVPATVKADALPQGTEGTGRCYQTC